MDFEKLRDKMVYDQIYRRGIDDQKIISVFTDIPRHIFVPEDKQSLSYEDYPVSIGEGQTISQPYMVALMTKSLAVDPGMKVLEIGTGSGYQAAILSALDVDLYTVEIVPVLAERAKRTIDSLGYKVHSRIGDGGLGWPEEAPFDRIIVSAVAEKVPDEWIKQLKVGGLIVMPLGGFLHQYLTTIEKTSEYDIVKKEICQCVFVPLTGLYARKDNT